MEHTMSEHVGGDSPNAQRPPPGRTSNRKARAKAPAQTAQGIDPPTAGAKAKRKRRSKAQLAAANAAKAKRAELKLAANGGATEVQPAIPARGAAPSSGRWTLPMACAWLEGAAATITAFHGLKGSITIVGKTAPA
jgi:hypothetical protein